MKARKALDSSPAGKNVPRNALIAAPARPGTYPWGAGFRKGAYLHVYLDKAQIGGGCHGQGDRSLADHFHLRRTSVGPDEVLLWLGELRGVAPDDATFRGADEWEFEFAADDRAGDKVTPCGPPMDEILEGGHVGPLPAWRVRPLWMHPMPRLRIRVHL